MNEVVERGAKAIFDTFYDGAWPPEPFDDGLRTAENYREAARAVIAQLREPTASMLASVYPDLPSEGPESRPWFPQVTAWKRAELADLWRKVIDEVLK